MLVAAAAKYLCDISEMESSSARCAVERLKNASQIVAGEGPMSSLESQGGRIGKEDEDYSACHDNTKGDNLAGRGGFELSRASPGFRTLS